MKRPTQREQQAALRCAASMYNTGDEQTGILNGYQSGVWRAAAQVVPAIQFGGSGAYPQPSRSRSSPRATSAASWPGGCASRHTAVFEPTDGLSDVLHPTNRKDAVP